MGSFSGLHWVIVALVILILFGRGRIADTMGDFGKGIRNFKAGLADESAMLPAATPIAEEATVPRGTPSS